MSLSKFLSQLEPRKLGWVFFAAIFGGTLLGFAYLYLGSVRHREAEIRREARESALAAAALVDVELHERLVRSEQRESADYDRLLRPLVRFHRDHPSIQYLWTTRVSAQGEQLFVLETSTDADLRKWQTEMGRSQDILPFLEPDPITDEGRKAIPVLRAGRAWVADDIYSDAHGRYIEARAPLVDHDGNFVGYLGVDYALDSYLRQIGEVRLTGAVALALVLIVSVVLARVVVEMRRQTLLHLGEVQRAEAAMREQRDLAEKASAAKSNLLAIATHDLKNPLSAIAGMSGLMLQEKRAAPKTPEVQEEIETLETIHASSQHLSEIIRGILTNEGLEQGGLQVRPVPVDVGELCATLIRFNTPAAQRKGIELRTDLPPGLVIAGDPKLLREAFDNYVSNGIKYSPPGKTVTVAAAMIAAEGAVEFSVRDEGPGLSEADQAKLYRKFQKLTARPTGGETSTGLGLSIVKTIAELHHGSVGCESRLGAGARFWIRLPLVQPAADAT